LLSVHTAFARYIAAALPAVKYRITASILSLPVFDTPTSVLLLQYPPASQKPHLHETDSLLHDSVVLQFRNKGKSNRFGDLSVTVIM
jgi:hypothetical protein